MKTGIGVVIKFMIEGMKKPRRAGKREQGRSAD
jgi:hypothetical protein